MTCSRNIPRLLLGAVLILLLWSADLTGTRPAQAACPWPISHAAALNYRRPLNQPDKERLFREDGLHGERSHIPQMIDLLDTN